MDKINDIELEKTLDFSKEFPEVGYQEWKNLVETELKGIPFDKKLITKTYEGINLQPIYTKDDLQNLSFINSLPGVSPFPRGNNFSGYLGSSWEIVQVFENKDFKQINETLKTELSNGFNSINLKISCFKNSNFGLNINSSTDFDIIFKDIELTNYKINFYLEYLSEEFLQSFYNYINEQRYDNNLLVGSINISPINFFILNNKIPKVLDSYFERIALNYKHIKEYFPKFKIINILGDFFHNAGASSVSELAISLSLAVEYINSLLNRGYDIDEIAEKLSMTLGIGSNFFMEIAKFRSARILWAKIISEYGGKESSQKLFIRAISSLFNKTITDPNVNMLRATTEAFSAVLGGVESIQILPYDYHFKESDEFSNRIARNVNILLREESNLNKIIDPAGGSYYVEKLTDEFLKSTWNEFQQIQSKGGVLEALKAGYIQTIIENTYHEKLKDISTRKSSIVGTNMYANIKESVIDYIKKDKSENYKIEYDGYDIQPINTKRIAEIYENLRIRSEKIETTFKSKPKVFLLILGPLKQYKARADFSKGFFEVGGFEVIYPVKGFEDYDNAINELKKSKSKIAVVCSTDETYPEIIPNLIPKIKTQISEIKIVLAGYPKEHIENFKKVGIDEFIFMGSNVVTLLDKFLNEYEKNMDEMSAEVKK